MEYQLPTLRIPKCTLLVFRGNRTLFPEGLKATIQKPISQVLALASSVSASFPGDTTETENQCRQLRNNEFKIKNKKPVFFLSYINA